MPHLALFRLMALLGGLIALNAIAEEQNPMLWSVSPYIWYTDTEYGIEAEGSQVGGGKITADDLFDSLDVGGQVVVEAGRAQGHWSGFVDATYLKMSDDETAEFEDLGKLRLDAESEQWIIDAAIAYWPMGVDRGGKLYAGVRYTDLDDEITLDALDLSTRVGTLELERDYTDLLMGGSYKMDLGSRWSVHGRGVYSTGDSEGIFQVQAFVMYKLKGRLRGLIAGYRYKDAEFEDNDITEDYEYRGPFVALNFRF